MDVIASMLARTGNADKNIRYVLIPSTWPNDKEQITEQEAAAMMILLKQQEEMETNGFATYGLP